MSDRWLSHTEIAKLIRADLKEYFPKIKFSVRTKTYSGGSSVTVAWTDGPSVKRVEEITGRYKGKGFDGMTDCSYYRPIILRDGTEARGGSYIHTRREHSDRAIDRAIEAVASYYGVRAGEYVPTVEDFQKGRAYSKSPILNAWSTHHDWQSLIYGALEDRTTVTRDQEAA